MKESESIDVRFIVASSLRWNVSHFSHLATIAGDSQVKLRKNYVNRRRNIILRLTITVHLLDISETDRLISHENDASKQTLYSVVKELQNLSEPQFNEEILLEHGSYMSGVDVLRMRIEIAKPERSASSL